MIPKHKNPSRGKNRDSKAPYNFVPLPEENPVFASTPPRDRYDPDLLTGKFNCILNTASPLYVRAMQTKHEFMNGEIPSEHAYGETKPDLIIPGSSLRGMIRTMVEIISHSKLAPVSDRMLFYRTVDNSSVGKEYKKRVVGKVLGGFFHQNGKGAWIEPALLGRVNRKLLIKKLGLKKLDHLYTQTNLGPNIVPKPEIQHREVFVHRHEKVAGDPSRIRQVEDFELKEKNGFVPATLVITGNIKKKKKEFVFVKQETDEKITITDAQLETFHSEDQLTDYQKNAFPREEVESGRSRAGWLKNGDPVFYLPSEDGKGVVFFGRAYMFRLPYLHSPKEMVPEKLHPPKGDGQPESSEGTEVSVEETSPQNQSVVITLDMAEALFGMVETGKGKQGAVAGRVFVTDALLDGNPDDALLVPPSEDPMYIKILSSPKPTAFQHYLTQRSPDDSGKLDYYNHPNSESTLRGHKLFWHKNNVSRDCFEADPARRRKNKSQYTDPIRPIKAGQAFRFILHYENLRPEELGALLWVLDKAADSEFRLKLGMGKPYGLGSVSIKFEPVITDRIQRYGSLFDGDQWNEGILPSVETDEKLKNAKETFSDFLLNNQAINPTEVDAVEKLDRIKALLAMLSWPGPASECTKYLGNYAPFKKRRVLPDPIAVKNNQLPVSSPEPPDEPKKDPNETVKMYRDHLESKDVSRSLPSKGDTVVMIVDDFTDNGDVFLIFVNLKRVEGADVFGRIKREDRGILEFKEGDCVKCIVLEDAFEEEGDIIIDCRPA